MTDDDTSILDFLALSNDLMNTYEMHRWEFMSDEPALHVVAWYVHNNTQSEAHVTDWYEWQRECADRAERKRIESYRAELRLVPHAPSPGIYHLHRTVYPKRTYFVTYSFVVRALTERRARLFAAVSDETDDDGDAIWLDSQKSSCEWIGSAQHTNERVISAETRGDD